MSGFGVRGGVSRCYPFWAEFRECLQTEEKADISTCTPIRDDYLECLHHKKEHAHVKAINEKVAQDRANGVTYTFDPDKAVADSKKYW